MPYYFVTYPIIGFQIVTAGFFQSVGIVKKAIFLSLSRQLVFLLPLILWLPHVLGCDGIWLSIPLSDLLATVVTAVMLYLQIKKFKLQDKIQVYGES